MLFHGFYILSTQPLIVSFIGNIYPLGDQIVDGSKKYPLPSWFKPKYVLNHIGGWAVPWHRMGRHKLRQVCYSTQGISNHLLVNAVDEEVVRKRWRLRGGYFSHNIYINEHLYQIENEHKIYDAIYTAQLTAFKRHGLAKNIEKLMIISYGGDLHEFCPELKHADFNRTFLPREELARRYNQSYAGLCLSAVEGAMFASCEYLLCGIPVVSTPSKGGRDEFFTTENSIIVSPEPEAVAQAVNHWKSHPPDPYSIRRQTLETMKIIRLEYCAHIANLIKQAGGSTRDPEILMDNYFSGPDGMFSRYVKLQDLEKTDLDRFVLK
jgi:glycosyltransferase involved in cell wall biosynthesis